MMADGMMGHATISSNAIAVDFDNADGVHLAATAPSGSALDGSGNIWYGGPGTGIEISVVPVVYSGGSAASAVTMLGFCDADAETDDEAPFEFAPDCEDEGKTSLDASPTFTLTVGGESIDVGADDILNGDDSIFPINLDYAGPGQPYFKPNPNDREGGWINAGVSFTSSSSRDDDAWLSKGASDAGVGGYTPQLRFAAVPSGDDDKGLTEALEAPAFQAVPPGAVPDSKADAYCVVVSAVDKLGNESALPDDEDGFCEVAGNEAADAVVDDPDTNDVDEEAAAVVGVGYAKLLQDLAAAKKAEDDDAIEDAEDALADAGLRVGVDTTPPELVFAGTSRGKDATALGVNPRYVLHVTDNRGLRVAEPVVDSLEIRDNDGDVDGAETTTTIAETGLPLVNVAYDEDGVGYYAYTAQAQDKAGNLSEAMSRVALHDITAPVSALIFARGKDAFNYDKTLVMADNLSVRDYTVVIEGPTALPAPVRLSRAMIDAYNDDLTQSNTVSSAVELPFIAVQSGVRNGDVADGDGHNGFTAYVTDQAGNSAEDRETLTITVVDPDGDVDGDLDNDEGVIEGVGDNDGYTIAVEDDDGIIGEENPVAKSDETITLTVTANVALATTVNPFADGVLFFAEVVEINRGLATDSNDPTDRSELRLIGMVAGSSAEIDTGVTERKWTYETEVSADDYYAIIGGAGDSNNIHALGVNGDGVAHRMTFGGQTAVPLVIAKR